MIGSLYRAGLHHRTWVTDHGTDMKDGCQKNKFEEARASQPREMEGNRQRSNRLSSRTNVDRTRPLLRTILRSSPSGLFHFRQRVILSSFDSFAAFPNQNQNRIDISSGCTTRSQLTEATHVAAAQCSEPVNIGAVRWRTSANRAVLSAFASQT